MGYSNVSRSRLVKAASLVVDETRGEDSVPTSKAPVFGAFFAIVVGAGTGLTGTVFFVYKWFSCLNYIIGRKLFRPVSLTVVWTALVGATAWATLAEAGWFSPVLYLGHIALAAYLLRQLKNIVACSPTTDSRRNWCSRSLVALWIIELVLLAVDLWESLPCALLVELGLLQKVVNLLAFDAAEARAPLEAKIAADWRRLRVVVAWGAIALSILLFFADIGLTVANVLSLKYGTYHGFALDGRFHFWLFFEAYSPHAAYQLGLWCFAALMILVGPEVLESARVGFTRRINRKTIRAAFVSLFPTVSNTQETEA